MTDKDLFGKRVRKNRTRLEILLAKHDRDTFPNRLQRLKYLRTVISSRTSLIGNLEDVFTINEAQAAFVNGQYIGAILLSQAFVERHLQIQMTQKGYPGATRGLKYIVKYCRDNQLLPVSALNKVDKLRNIRNPFAHLTPYDNQFTFTRRLIQMASADSVVPERVLCNDAKQAIVTMVAVLFLELQ